MTTGPFADALARNRERFNAKFIAARHANPKLAADAFLEHLAANVEPAVRAVAEVFAEKVDPVTAALYDLSLELFGHGLLGAQTRHPALVEAWRRVLPAAPRLLAREPARLAGSVCNAVYKLASTPGARAGEWVDAMAGLAPRCPDVATFQECGKVAAWRCGLPQFRAGALAAAKAIDPPLAAVALGGAEGVTEPAALRAVIDRLADDPWMDVEAALAPAPAGPRPPRLVGRAGAFRGFGGAFARPPTVSRRGGDFVVTDGQAAWVLRADRFGSALFRTAPPAGPPPLPAARLRDEHVRLGPEGAIQWGDQSATFPDLADPSSIACDGKTLALTLPTSHHVFLLAKG